MASGHLSTGSSGAGRSPGCGGHPGCLEPREARARQAPDDRQHCDQGPPPCGRRKRGTPKEAPGHSRGGFSTKIHLRVNGAGLPIRTEITPGQDSDYTGYDLVMADNLPQPAVLVADRGYDSDKIREDIESRNALPMIPMRKNRKVRKVVDMTIYTLRNMVERCFNKLKNSRRLATRYDKTADSFLGFIDIACIRLWLRHL
uniref:Transposase OrfB n=1 Tax=Paracoccus kondratievae TaxID=135740 RepID=A0A0G3B6F7_9RHOB|nr:transposase OrfB [Paracoccus kondratievae]